MAPQDYSGESNQISFTSSQGSNSQFLEGDCLKPDEIIYEFSFSFYAEALNGETLNITHFLDIQDCVYPRITPPLYSYNGVTNVALNEVTMVPFESLFDVKSKGLDLFSDAGISLDAISFSDCPIVEGVNCKYPYLSFNGQDYDLLDAIENNLMVGENSDIRIKIKEHPRNYHYHPSINFNYPLFHCDISATHFLPSYYADMNRVVLSCPSSYNDVIAVNLSSTSHENLWYEELERVDHSKKLVNIESTEFLMWYDYLGTSGPCMIDFKRSGSNGSEDTLIKRFEFSGADIGDCRDYKVHSMSDDQEYFVLTKDHHGQFVVDFDTAEMTYLSSRQYHFHGDWLPGTDSFVYLDSSNEQIVKFDSQSKISSNLFSFQELENLIVGDLDWDTKIETAPYFGSHSISVMTKDNDGNNPRWSLSKIDFSEDFQSYQITQKPDWIQSSGIKCGGSGNYQMPSLIIPTGHPSRELGGITGCNEHIIVGIPDEDEIFGQRIDHSGDGLRIWNNVTDYYNPYSICWFGADLDYDGVSDDCDMDIDGDGVKNWYDRCDETSPWITEDTELVNGCVDNLSYYLDERTHYYDLDSDGHVNSQDSCYDGLRNWSTYTFVSPYEFDYDDDGCHDLVEDDDDDNDGVLDVNDACPVRKNGHIDLDSDKLCEGDDLDDDGDNYSDIDEVKCDSNPESRESTPSDIDGDFLCDNVDEDMDGDGIINELDTFPMNWLEWNDLDQDGIGNNSDDCVGTYGTSTIDRLGCLDQDGDGVSDLNDLDPYDAEIGLDEYDGPRLDIVEENETNLSTDQTNMASESDGVVVFSAIGVFIVAGIIIFVRSRRSSPDDDEEEYGGADDYYRNVTANTVTSSHESSSQRIPEYSLSGIQDESGYEVLEYPEASEQWWWKDTENQCWVIWE